MPSDTSLARFLQFESCEDWIKAFVFEYETVNNAEVRITETTGNEFYDFGGLSVFAFDGEIYKAQISPLEVRKNKLNLFQQGLCWVDAVEYMGFHDFLEFRQRKNIKANRLFLITSVCHEPIVQIDVSGMILDFSEDDPYKLENIFIHFGHQLPGGKYGLVPLGEFTI